MVRDKLGRFKIKYKTSNFNKKVCSRCGIEKPKKEFHKRKDNNDGFRSHCKKCQHQSLKKRLKEIKENNPKEWNRRKKQWALKHRENRKLNPEKYKKWERDWKNNNIEKYKKNSKNAWKKRMEKIEFRIGHNVKNLILLSLKGNKNGRHWEHLVGYTTRELKEHLEKQFEPWMNWDNWGRHGTNKRTWQIDHKKPIKSFRFENTKDPEFKKCWALENLQPLDALENARKDSVKTPSECPGKLMNYLDI